MPFVSLTDPPSFPDALQGGAFAIGNFDGVHRGHKAVIDAARALAGNLNGPALALTFEPHPRTVFRPEARLFRLSPPDVKATLLERAGLDGAVTLTFDRIFAETTAERFLAELLAGRLKAKAVAIGYDFSFGKGREGNADFIRARAGALGLSVSVVDALRTTDGAVSSSAIRRALERGDIASANAQFGHEWFVRGEVVHGEKVGRTLGYPTANMVFDKDFALADGIYAVRATIGGKIWPAVASYGRKPTFGDTAPLLETFVFDYSGDLYGQTIDIAFVGYIRGQIRFEGVEALIERMNEDSRIAREMLTR
jgi:riboflavin kinase/FMN adenylyltransferase